MRWRSCHHFGSDATACAPMHPDHAQDDRRHIESHLPAVGIFPGDWWTTRHIHALVTAEHREDSQPTDETTDIDPPMR